MPSNNYGPFRGGEISTGSSNNCPCGKRNQHSLSEGGKCDWLRRPKAERERILQEKAMVDRMLRIERGEEAA